MGDPEADRRPLRFVSWLTPGIDVEVFQLAADLVSRALSREVELVVARGGSGPPPDEDAFSDDSPVDLGWMCSTAYVQQPNAQLVGIAWAPADPDAQGRAVYFSDLVVSDGSEIHDIATLSGRRVGCNDPVSLSGHYGLRFGVADLGLRLEDHAEPVFTGGHLRSLAALDAGEVDAAVIDSVVRLRHRPDVKVAQRLGPWPTQPLVCHPRISPPEREAICASFLEAHTDPAVSAALARAELASFVRVDESHYDLVAQRLSDIA